MPIPRTIIQGDSHRFIESPERFTPASGFAWFLYLRAPLNSENAARHDSPGKLERGGFNVKIAGVVNGGNVEFALPATESAKLQPGVYAWSIRAEKVSTDEAHTIRTGNVRVNASIDSQPNFDDQNDARAIVKACTDQIKFLLGKGGAAVSYTYNGKSLTRYSMQELQDIRKTFLREAILQETRAGKRKFKRNVFSIFGVE